MEKITRKQAGWICFIFLFLAGAFSFTALFRGSLWFLIGALVCLIAGMFFLKRYLSSQSLS